MKILVTGKGGQLAWELEQAVPKTVKLVSLNSKALDITSKSQILDAVSLYAPDLIINAAGYTAVDNAETDPLAYSVNHLGSKYLALACKQAGIPLIHVSSDFVFDGSKTTPYQTDDQPSPINAYGDSKLKGEQEIAKILGNEATIIRTAWVYSANGNNFVKTMLRLLSEKNQLGIVYDQVGTPTWANGLANMIWALVAKHNIDHDTSCDITAERGSSGLSSNASGELFSAVTLLHWSDAGVASWYDFAVAIQELAIEKMMLCNAIPIKPISASHYPTPAKRPCFSVIDKTTAEQASGVQTIHWRKQLSKMLDQLATCEKIAKNL